MKRWRIGVLIAAGFVVLATVGGLVWYHLPQSHAVYTDADTIRTAADIAPLRDVLWQPPTKLSEIVNTAEQDYEPRFAWDGLTLYFVRGKAGENADIFASTRTPTGWTEPAPLAAINTEHDELGPEPTADGQSLYFYSDRPGGLGGYDLWVSRRDGEEWLAPTNLGPAVNGEFNDYGPAISPDGHTLLYASNRPAPEDAKPRDPAAWQATVREDLFHRTYDLYSATISDRGVGAAQSITILNTPFNEGAPCYSPSGDFVYFSSDRTGGEGGFDLYRSRVVRGAFESPANLGEPVNTPANELDPALMARGFGLVFSSDRGVGTQERGNAGTELRRPDYDLYQSFSREVFREVEQSNRPPIDWAALIASILPNLLWALLALLLLLLLLAIIGDVRKGRLTLLARCLLASLMAHLLLMMLFNFWRVTAGVLNALHRPGQIQIALAPPTQGDALAAQIRGDMTEVEPPSPESFEIERVEMPPAFEPVSVQAQLAAYRGETPIERSIEMPTEAVDSMQPPMERTPPTPSAVRNVSEQALELMLPKSEQPTNEPESDPQFDIAAEASPLTRAPIAVATSQPVRPPREVALAPQKGEARDDADVRRSLAGSISAADSAPPTQRKATPIAPSADSASALPTLAVALPQSGEPRANEPQAAESTPEVSAVRIEPSRSAGAPLPTSPIADSQIVLDPKTKSAVPTETTLASSVEIRSADSAPRGVNSRLTPTIRTVVNAPPTPLDLSLPTSSVVPKPQSEESAPTVAAVTTPAYRSPLRTPIDQRADDSPTQAAIDPPAAAALEVTELRVSPSAPEARDAIPQAPTLTAAPARRTTPSVDAFDLDLRLPPENDPLGQDLLDQLPEPAIGVIVGRIRDKATGEPLANATVRLDLPDSPSLIAESGSDGRYEIPIPTMPDFFALSASRDGFVPASANVPASSVRDRRLKLDFDLEPESDDVIVLEDQPNVHHLGNDRWEGSINSQFQRNTEGRVYEATFKIRESQANSDYTVAAVCLLAKGVQCPPQILINGQAPRKRMSDSPTDGGFGVYVIPFDPAWLVEGTNTIEIHAVTCMGDLDDWEFVNVQVRLLR